MGIATTSFMNSRRARDTIEFLEYCNSLGAGGIQASLTSTEPAYIKTLRGKAERYGMSVEVMAGLPRGNIGSFEHTVIAAKEVGAIAIRSTAPGPRRYEAFSSLDDWKKAEAQSRATLERAVPVVDKHRIPLAIENHRDRTLAEFAGLMKKFGGEYFGACVDFGNNIALLDDPMEVVKQLAQYTVSAHIKDMAVEEYSDGFLLAEVPLGEGILPLQEMVDTIAKAHPKTRMTLEMITRNPTPVPCLTEKYWTAMPDRSRKLAGRTLTMVRAHKPTAPLPRLDDLDPAARQRLEEDNVKRCLSYAREHLRLS
jgi:sugar phosphate isomerase/epimerase